jgi:subtilisin family serine protease
MTTEPVTLVIGGRRITLSRSERYVGLRSQPNGEAAMAQALAGMACPLASPASLGEELGGFRLVELGQACADKVDRKLDLLRAEDSVRAGTHVFHLGYGNHVPVVPTGELYLAFHEEASAEKRQAVLDRHALRVVEGRGPDAVVVRTTLASANPVTTAARLQKEPAVAIAEPDLATPIERRELILPADQLLVDQWHLENRGRHRGSNLGGVAGADARVVRAWRRLGSFGSSDVVLAVIDDGFDLAHPDLRGPDKIVGGWDFTRHSAQPFPGTGDWHGTACAGIALGNAGGGRILGAAPAARLMPVRWGPHISDREIEAWFEHVTRSGAWIVSCSWGAEAPLFPLSTRMAKAISRCATEGRGGKGCVIVFAAGNASHDIDDAEGGTLDGFATHPDVIAVAASDSRDLRAGTSNFGEAISLCAPSSSEAGWGVLTADVAGDGAGHASGDYAWAFGGTSSACPLVAGVAALVLSANPELTAQDVRQILSRTARQIGAPEAYVDGHSRHFGHGCVDAEAAVDVALRLEEAQAE